MSSSSNESSPPKLRTWERRVLTCKQKHRPKLKNWERDQYATIRQNDFNNIINEIDPYAVARLSAKNLSVESFIQNYEIPSIPCVISDIPEVENWKAVTRWNFDKLDYFKHRFFKVGEDDDGKTVKMKMKYFLKYLKKNKDDSPLYIFDSRYDDDSVSKRLLEDYVVPSYFPEDLFSLVGEKRRPPYRWFLVGPQRSGTCVHKDPLGTSAWNTVLQGRKLWVIFPPYISKSTAKALDVIAKGEDDEAVNYFVDHLPRLKKKDPDCEMRLFIQYPGDTVFIPGGWWHAVLNIDDTIAITQNYCSHANFERVWKKTRTGRRKMAQKWLRLLKVNNSDLADLAVKINADTNFSFEEEEDRHKQKKRKKSD